jgi:octaprenyl-diphosphate synthase
MNLKDISLPINEHLGKFDAYYKDAIKTETSLLNLVLRYMSKTKGKQIRPILVFLSAGAAGTISDRTYIGATMVELLHTATLVHDDVVDRAGERRGLASINAEWNNKIAVLVGDYLLSKGLSTSVENNEFEFLAVTSSSVRRMSEGELLAIERAKKFDIKEETYFKIISDKTASLIASCCCIGAISTTDKKEIRSSLSEYGENLGIAFQLRDDLFDYTSRTSIIGKPVGNDIKERKITLPLIYSFQHGEANETKKIQSMIKKGKLTDADVKKVVEYVDRSGGLEYTKHQALIYRDKAIDAISGLRNSPHKDSLQQLADFVLERSF